LTRIRSFVAGTRCARTRSTLEEAQRSLNEAKRCDQQQQPLSYKERRRQKNPDRKRHGARNQDKSKLFVRWLEQTFSQQFLDDRPILDVAGGKGEVAARLCVCHNQRVVLVDPRDSDPHACFVSTVLPKIPSKWQGRLKEKSDPQFLETLFATQFHQIISYFDETSILESELQQAIESCCLLIGLHADGATEAIIQAALKYNKPFAVVPCCVFPKLFPQRMVHDVGAEAVQVRTVEQFCKYLLGLDDRFQTAVLPFEGRNVAVYWDGRSTTRT
jgi:hypothetical protein